MIKSIRFLTTVWMGTDHLPVSISAEAGYRWFVGELNPIGVDTVMIERVLDGARVAVPRSLCLFDLEPVAPPEKVAPPASPPSPETPKRRRQAAP